MLPELGALLKETLGVIVYQETGDADLPMSLRATRWASRPVRRAMGKKDEKEMKKAARALHAARRPTIIPRTSRGPSRLMAQFAGMASTNPTPRLRAAGVSHGVLKTHYPVEFWPPF